MAEVFRKGKRGRELEYLIDAYKRAHPDEDEAMIEPHRVAEWAIARKLWERPAVSPDEVLRRELSRFLRAEYTTDPQGRQVRKYHKIIYVQDTAAGPKKRSRSYEIFHAPEEHMKASLQLRRRSALDDVRQLSLDFESYNENNVVGANLPPIDFNFNPDLELDKFPTHYPIEPPDDDDDEDV